MIRGEIMPRLGPAQCTNHKPAGRRVKVMRVHGWPSDVYKCATCGQQILKPISYDKEPQRFKNSASKEAKLLAKQLQARKK